jgi:predicted transcriptional regulator
MASVKSTFTLDLETVARLSEIAERLHRSKSAIVREAIHDYSERADRLSASERRRMLAAFDELVPRIPERPIDEVEAELSEIREARRSGGRGTADWQRS